MKKDHKPSYPWYAVTVTNHEHLVNIGSDEPNVWGNDHTVVASMVPKDSWFHTWLLEAEAREKRVAELEERIKILHRSVLLARTAAFMTGQVKICSLLSPAFYDAIQHPIGAR